MSLSYEEIERLHNAGKMPDWAYYQQNGKSATLNLHEQTEKFKEYLDQLEYKRKEKKEEADQKKNLEKEIYKTIDEALKDVLGGLQISK